MLQIRFAIRVLNKVLTNRVFKFIHNCVLVNNRREKSLIRNEPRSHKFTRNYPKISRSTWRQVNIFTRFKVFALLFHSHIYVDLSEVTDSPTNALQCALNVFVHNVTITNIKPTKQKVKNKKGDWNVKRKFNNWLI